jgi:hypothetical protein
MKPTLLDVDLALRRESAPFWLACTLALAGVALYVLSARPLDARLDERRSALERVEREARVTRAVERPRKSVFEERLDAFAGALCEKERLNAFVGTVFEQAALQGLALAQAEYKLEHDKAGGFSAYQMTLPVRGPYPRLRRFVDSTLAEVSCAAIEDVDFKREAIGASETEARLRFIFFLKGDAR